MAEEKLKEVAGAVAASEGSAAGAAVEETKKSLIDALVALAQGADASGNRGYMEGIKADLVRAGLNENEIGQAQGMLDAMIADHVSVEDMRTRLEVQFPVLKDKEVTTDAAAM